MAFRRERDRRVGNLQIHSYAGYLNRLTAPVQIGARDFFDVLCAERFEIRKVGRVRDALMARLLVHRRQELLSAAKARLDRREAAHMPGMHVTLMLPPSAAKALTSATDNASPVIANGSARKLAYDRPR